MNDTDVRDEKFYDKRDAKKEYNKQMAPGILNQAEIPFTAHNKGEHLIIYDLDKKIPKAVVDIWPRTGKWRIRNKGKHQDRRGIFNLIKWWRRWIRYS